MIAYSAGFMFFEDEVLLITKARPSWQAGLLNGVGGKVEDGELHVTAMVREFREETGVDTAAADWTEFAELLGGRNARGEPTAKIVLYCARAAVRPKARSMTDEPVAWYLAKNLPSNVIGQLRWQVPLALEVLSGARCHVRAHV